MKIFTNEYHEICDINATTRSGLTEYEIDDDSFPGKCDSYIRGYKYEPQQQFELNEDGTNRKDESGNEIHVLDDAGNKIFTGFSLYPFIDYNVLLRIQAEHDAQELLINELTQSIVDNDYRLSLMELKGEK